MPKIGFRAALTVPGPQEYSSLKPEVQIYDIDTDGDVDEQLAAARAALDKVMRAAEEDLAQETANMSGLAVEGLGLAKQFSEFKAFVEKRLEQVIGEIKRQKAVVDRLDPAKSKVKSGLPDPYAGADQAAQGEIHERPRTKKEK